MKYLKDYHSVMANEGQHFIFVDLNELNLGRKEMLVMFSTFTDFMNKFKCSLDEFCEILEMYGIQDRSLFDFTTYTTPVLIRKDGVYTQKWESSQYGGGRCVKKYYDVYLCENSFCSVQLNIVAIELVKRHFPFLLEPPFIKCKKRFGFDISKLPKSINTLVSDIEFGVGHEITIGDLIKLYTDPSYKDSFIDSPDWDVYANGDVFINVGNKNQESHSIFAQIEELFAFNWEAIEERNVYSIPLYDENGKRIEKELFNGKQKDAPYFNTEKARKLKEELAKSYFKAK